jgi:hypothetical protein
MATWAIVLITVFGLIVVALIVLYLWAQPNKLDVAAGAIEMSLESGRLVDAAAVAAISRSQGVDAKRVLEHLRKKGILIDPTTGMRIIDHRSEAEKRIEERARAGLSLGNEADEQVAHLLQIGASMRFISASSGGAYDDKCRHTQARAIGSQLYELGSHDLMLAAYYRVGLKLGSGARGDLEHAWNGIGSWLA